MPTNDTSEGRKPSHRLFLVTGEGDKAFWTQIGAAWPNRDDKGFNLSLEAIPLSGRIVMREPSQEDDA